MAFVFGCSGGEFFGGPDDGNEGGGFEACAAYECAIDVGLTEEDFGVVRFDAAAVENTGAFGKRRIITSGEPFAKVFVRGFGLFRGSGYAGTDGPDGFVGDDDTGCGVFIDLVEGALHLPVEDFFGEACGAFVEEFSDAEYGYEPAGVGVGEFSIEEVVCFAEERAAFAVTDEHILAAAVFEHVCGDFACEGALWFGIEVLGAEFECGAGDFVGDGEEVGERGADEDFDTGLFGRDSGGKFAGEINGGLAEGVHLPVSGDQKPTHG